MISHDRTVSQTCQAVLEAVGENRAKKCDLQLARTILEPLVSFSMHKYCLSTQAQISTELGHSLSKFKHNRKQDAFIMNERLARINSD